MDSQQAGSPVSIAAEIAGRITYATHHCDVPLIADLVLRNESGAGLDDLVLTLRTTPQIVAPRLWPIDRIGAGQELRIKDRGVSIAGGLLDQLGERLRVELTLTVTRGETVLATRPFEITALARNEWGGAAHMPELLAAFVMPNDPAVQRLLRAASGVLERAGRPSSLEGYQSKSRARSWEIVAAIWAAVTTGRLTYAEPPASFERQGQKLRTPSVIEEQKLATCLDTALLFAAAIEQAGLNPLIALTQGHAICGAWLQPQTLESLTCDDPMELRKAIGLQELILFETTLATGPNPTPLARAIEDATRRVGEERAAEFIYALDIKQARKRQITPLPSLTASPIASAPDGNGAPPAMPRLEATPDLPGFDLGIDVALIADTPATRLETWRRRLLDLTKRNRLLNLKPSVAAIPIFCPDTVTLEDRIADGKRLSVIAAPRPDKTQPAAPARLTGEDPLRRLAAEALERNEIIATVPEADLQNGLLQLYRKARTDIQEGGSNTLFLAFGMLHWRPPGESSGRGYRAPLLLIPVKLERRSAASPVRLLRHEDEPVFNLTLLQMLRQDFGIPIPDLAGELPKDASGIDTARVWAIVRGAVRHIQGFEVVEEVVLSTFSFAKYLMWKDLTDRLDALKASPFVRHLVETPREAYQSSSSVVAPAESDDRIKPTELFLPLNADSSQIVAVHASGRGGDFVLEGPPGTGKSETIGNVIAHNLALGRRVLFVSEKMAALEVVYRRLKDKGLGDFCLELHSNRANKRDVIAQLGQSWTARRPTSAGAWEEQATRLGTLRDQLNGLVRALHQPGLAGISPRQAIGRALRYRDIHTVALDWGSDAEQTTAGLAELEDIARRLGQHFAELKPDDFAAFGSIGASDWSFAWQSKLIEGSRALLSAIDCVIQPAQDFAQRLGWPSAPRATLDDLARLAALAELVPHAGRADLGFALAPDAGETLIAFTASIDALEQVRTQATGLSTPYPTERITDAPIDAWIAAWARAETSIWPLSILRRRQIRQAIGTHFALAQPAQPARDLPILRTMAGHLAEIRRHAPSLPASTPWRGLDSDAAPCRDAIVQASALRTATLRLASDADALAERRSMVRRVFVDGRDLLAPGTSTAESARIYLAAFGELRRLSTAFIDATQCLPPDTVRTLAGLARTVIERQTRLAPWCAWVEVRTAAAIRGLSRLVQAIERGTTPPDSAAEALRTAYCRWLAPHLIDQRPELRRFSAIRHEDLIRSFRALDKTVADLTVDVIRAKLSAGVPGMDDPRIAAGFTVLRREMQKKMRHKPVRELVRDMGESLLALTPCLMMSPLSVAQFLSTDAAMFDLVVFDEASQITVWDAVGAIARGRNVVIVGDPKQMPPTTFFDKAAGSDDEEVDSGEDLESILDEALSAGLRWHRLTGHYRSRHESLIAFSNHAYYESQLVTYPSPETRASAVSLRRVAGIYGKGSSRTNPIEARAVVEEVVRRLRDPVQSRLSIGIVTLNAEQQRLIEDLLDHERRADPDIEAFFGDQAAEPVFIKNLETVQGDQRDVILLSIGYGPTTPESRTLSMNFGPLNRKGGERRLNVAITRATSEVVVFASFDAGMVDLARSSAKAVEDLKHYLDFAERGPVALAQAARPDAGVRPHDSDFEHTVAEGLRALGWTVHSQIGVSRFRIDLAVVHPDEPGRYLAGIECDGASYYASPTARDRDRVRQQVLEGLGWTLLRIWSTDFFLAPEETLKKVHDALTARLTTEDKPGLAEPAAPYEAPESPEPTLEHLATTLIDTHGPITFKLLSEQVARAQGLQRTGAEIKRRVWAVVQSARRHDFDPEGNPVFWPSGVEPSPSVPFRGLTVAGVPRTWSDVPHVERLGLAQQVIADNVPFPTARMAERIGLARLTAKARTELEALLALAAAQSPSP